MEIFIKCDKIKNACTYTNVADWLVLFRVPIILITPSSIVGYENTLEIIPLTALM